MDVISCRCRAEGRVCGAESCSCHKERVECILYCLCRGDKCHNPHRQKGHDGMEERNDDVDFDGIGDDEHMRGVGVWELRSSYICIFWII